MIKLIKEPSYDFDTTKIEMEFNDESLGEVLDNMTNFLRCCGYVIDNDATLEIVNEREFEQEDI